MSSGAGFAAAKTLETFDEAFVFGSELVSEASLLLSGMAAPWADFTAAFGCKVVCGLGAGVFVDGGAMVDDVSS